MKFRGVAREDVRDGADTRGLDDPERHPCEYEGNMITVGGSEILEVTARSIHGGAQFRITQRTDHRTQAAEQEHPDELPHTGCLVRDKRCRFINPGTDYRADDDGYGISESEAASRPRYLL